MADEDTNRTPPRSAADKDKSRQQNRPVTGKGADKKGGASGGSGKNQPKGQSKGGGPNRSSGQKGSGNRPSGGRPPNRSGGRNAPPPRRSMATLATVGVIALVIILVVVLVIVKLTASNTNTSAQAGWTAAPASVVDDVTNIPASVYNTVGVNSPTQVNPPVIVHGQQPLTFDGKPGVFYFGAEYCPYCGAERWAILASTSRFGKWTDLGEMESSSTDVFPSTQTFTFLKAAFSSPYFVMKTDEVESNVASASGGYETLQTPTKQEADLVNTYDGPKYFPGSTTGSFPFVDFGNKALISGASYTPAILQGQSREAIASGLDDPTDPVTQTIIATSNYMSASICAVTGDQPADVCTSRGVMAAAKKLGLH
jgi:hypothetical protein